jgi:hypothetical protein
MVRFNRTNFNKSRRLQAKLIQFLKRLNQQSRPKTQPADISRFHCNIVEKIASWPVSRVLYGPRPLRRENVAAIHLGRMLPCASRNLPER